MEDTLVLGTSALRRKGSSPLWGIFKYIFLSKICIHYLRSLNACNLIQKNILYYNCIGRKLFFWRTPISFYILKRTKALLYIFLIPTYKI